VARDVSVQIIHPTDLFMGTGVKRPGSEADLLLLNAEFKNGWSYIPAALMCLLDVHLDSV
jgi:hypothetical protein